MRVIVSILLSLVVVCTSMHLRIDTHICQGNLVGMALFGEAERCPHHDQIAEVPHCHKHNTDDQDSEDKEKGCCEDKVYSIEGIDVESFFQKAASEVFFSVALIAPLPKITARQKVFLYVTPHYLNYKPPLIQVDDFPVYLQTFLIQRFPLSQAGAYPICSGLTCLGLLLSILVSYSIYILKI